MSALRYALLSVSDKRGLVPFAQQLVAAGYTLLSTGGTAKALAAAGLQVVLVSEFTGSPEIMGGRVKTLHPKVHGGILADRVAHAPEMLAHGLSPIDVVVVNLYPFESSVGPDTPMHEAIEQVDIGGPTMVRAAAKNHAHVAVVVSPDDYEVVGAALMAGSLDAELRKRLALRAFRHTSRYDAVIADWFTAALRDEEPAPERALPLSLMQNMRYGENPHQRASFYADANRAGRSLARAVQHQGLALSFNNLADLDAALRVVFDLPQPGVVIVKHNNPCGAAMAGTLSEAFQEALAGDPVSAYGGIVVFNRPLSPEDVRVVKQSKVFFEVLAAPGFTGDALARLATRERLRVLELPSDWAASAPSGQDARRVQGGWLMQDWDLGLESEWRVVSARQPTAAELDALRFAWITSRHVKSNAITLAMGVDGGFALNGVGAGQMSRVDSVRLAISKATRPTQGCVLASDAFFPFADGVEVALDAGVRALVQPGGSVRDAEVIAAADARAAAMVFTGVRHFRH